MKGRNGREYTIEIDDRGIDAVFKIIDKRTGEVVDDGWLVISKNGVVRIDRT